MTDMLYVYHIIAHRWQRQKYCR